MTTPAALRLARVGLLAGIVLAVLLLSGMSGDGQVVVPVMLVCTLVLGGVGYGITKQKADAAHARLDRHEAAVTNQFEISNQKLDELRDLLTDLRLDIAGRPSAKRPGGPR